MILRTTITRLLVALLPAVAMGCASEYDQSGMPAATNTTQVDVHVGKSVSSDSTRIGTVSDHFTPGETVHAVIDVPPEASGTMDVRWVFGGSGGQTVSEQSVPIVPGTASYHVNLDPPDSGNKPGEYQLEITLNGDRVEVERFTVSPE